jgi:hypothetical protein
MTLAPDRPPVDLLPVSTIPQQAGPPGVEKAPHAVRPRHRGLWHSILLSIVPHPYRRRAARWIPHLPMVAVLGIQVALTLRLANTANPDEALYLQAGHDYLAEFSHGTALPEQYGSYFSGLPTGYPIVAALLDDIGGLRAARLFGLLCMLVATLAVHATARALGGGRRGGTLAALAFTLAAPVLMLGNFATFDAPMIALLGVATATAAHGRSVWAAGLAGLLAALAGVLKYTGLPFILVMVLVALCTPTPRRWLRAVAVLIGACIPVAMVYLRSWDWLEPGFVFTTAARSAQNARPVGVLLADLAVTSGILIVLGIAGAVVLLRRLHGAARLIPLVLLGAGLAVPMAQLRILEYTSFEKHQAITALFVAPLVGQLARLLSRHRLRLVACAALVAWALFGGAVQRSVLLYTEWPDATPVVSVIRQDPEPGSYLVAGAASMGYYGRDLPGVHFQEPWVLYGAGPEAIRDSVRDGTYRAIIYRSGRTGSDDIDDATGLLAQLVAADPKYELVAEWPVHEYDENHWFYWRLRG